MASGEADPFRLERFVAAQDQGGTYRRAVAELRAGRKRSHWIWFVFPQVAGLGSSAMARAYAIGSLAEARAYAGHPVLGPRLRECARILADTAGATGDGGAGGPGGVRAADILGDIDAVKVRSSMTLFAVAAPAEPAFGAVLGRYFDGQPDPATLDRLDRLGPPGGR